MDGGRSIQSFSCWSELQQEKPVVHDSHRGGGGLFSLMGCGRGLFKLKPANHLTRMIVMLGAAH